MGRKYTIDHAHDVANRQGGLCLTVGKNINCNTQILWRCSSGHEWQSRLYNVVHRGSWCRICRSRLNESKCRFVFESLSGALFPNRRDAIKGYELDGYCEKLKIAFEYNGEQHYKPVKLFGGNHRFIQQVIRDSSLRSKCSEQGIRLIEVPYYIARSDDEIVRHVSQELNIVTKTAIDWDQFYLNLSSIKILMRIAKNNGGSLLSKRYQGTDYPLEWKCKKGHIWKASATTIKRGSWCPFCAGCNRKTIDDARILASSRGGFCLSETYKNKKQKLLWRCYNGHEWEASFGNVFSNHTWCAICAGKKKLTIEQMHELSLSRGGKCLSNFYNGCFSKLTWSCKCGYIWEATPNHVKSGSWCPKCSKRAKPTIEDMRRLAEDRGGLCLSTTYDSARTKMHWRCSEGHEWLAVPNSIKDGRWCRKCHIIKRFGHPNA